MHASLLVLSVNTYVQVFTPTVLLLLSRTFWDEGYTHLLLEADASLGS